jgi:hypothetical protein
MSLFPCMVIGISDKPYQQHFLKNTMGLQQKFVGWVKSRCQLLDIPRYTHARKQTLYPPKLRTIMCGNQTQRIKIFGGVLGPSADFSSGEKISNNFFSEKCYFCFATGFHLGRSQILWIFNCDLKKYKKLTFSNIDKIKPNLMVTDRRLVWVRLQKHHCPHSFSQCCQQRGSPTFARITFARITFPVHFCPNHICLHHICSNHN